ncbi:hypothetical protein BUALT_Bualt19G0018200 [Buddleja alternifolia]|uniref:EF-hand domain-containing protein n=1 Tax=Buddleja alternifolia TaxID=168488 RepID=A0AAV6W8M7_9LAMI|nr:hypothetical protein BUALT_Bualt19G0018200 [Buddleja alternifolia]
MPKSEHSDPQSEEETENESANENGGSSRNDYEKQRLNRIEENKSRMEALGLHKMANSFMESVQKTQKKKNEKKGKAKMVDEDEEYNPTEDDEEMSFSDDENDEDFSVSQKKKVKKNTSTPKKGAHIQKPLFDSDFIDDDDDALMKAIALSLQDSAELLGVKNNSPSHGNIATSKTPATHIIDTKSDKRNDILEDSGKRKRKKPITSRVQMSEDEMLVHFFQFDETGKGGFTLRDIQRLATAHDFIWSEKEIADMIFCFDSDGDGKINFDDFCKIVGRCNMLKGREIA